MKYTDMRDSTFFHITLFYGIMYTDDFNTFIKEVELFGVDIINEVFLELGIDLINKYKSQADLPNHCKNNLALFVNYCRFNNEVMDNKELKKEIYSKCNILLGIINTTSDNNYNGYHHEIDLRYKGLFNKLIKAIDYLLAPDLIEDELNCLREMDFLILCTHSEFIEEEDFDYEIEAMLANPFYLISIKYILDVYPEIFKDESFKQRVLNSLKVNEELISAAKGKPIESSLYEIDTDDKEVLLNKRFILTNRRLKRKVKRIQKDS